MDEPKAPALNTREFVVKWNATVDEHLVARLAERLEQAAAAHRGARLDPVQSRLLAHHLVSAFHIAGETGGGVPDAVDYLIQAVAEVSGA